MQSIDQEKWDLVDWEKQNVLIAIELGCSDATVSNKRRLLGKRQSKNFHKRTKRKYKWDQVDWSKQNVVITTELGCSPGSVSKMRKLLGKLRPQSFHKYTKIKYQFDQVDWDKQNAVIAIELGCSDGFISKARKLLKKQQPKNFHKWTKTTKYQWDQVDWLKNDSEISRELGCSFGLVSNNRKKLCKPTSPNYYRVGADKQPTVKYDFSNVDWCKNDASIAREMRCSPSLPGRYRFLLHKPKLNGFNECQKTGAKHGRKFKYDWQNVDWTEPDSVIARRMGCHIESVHFRRVRRLIEK